MKLSELPAGAIALRGPPAPEPAPVRKTLADLAALVTMLRGRCRLMGGAIAGQTWTLLEAEDDAALAQLETVLTRMSPFADSIRRLIARGEKENAS